MGLRGWWANKSNSAQPQPQPRPAASQVVGPRREQTPRAAARVTESTGDSLDEERSSVYLHSSRWDQLLRLRPDGMPPFRLVQHGGALWLAEETTGLLVNVANQKLRGLGLWTGQLRGFDRENPIVRTSNLQPKMQLALVREPDNAYDEHAVAVRADAGVIGYVNKRMARALAAELDAGTPLSALSLGQARWMAADPGVLRWLLSR